MRSLKTLVKSKYIFYTAVYFLFISLNPFGALLGNTNISYFDNYVFAGQKTKTLYLNDCIKIAIESNPKLKSADFMVDSAQEDLNAAKSDFLPSVSAGANYNNIISIDSEGPTDSDYIDQQNTNYNIGVSQVLYAGNRLVNSRDRAALRKQMFLEEKDFSKAQISYQVKETYFQLMKAKQDIQIGIDTIKRLEADVISAKAFYEKEMTPYAQVLQAEVDLADVKQQVSKLKNTVDRKRSDLFVLMNQPFTDNINFAGGLEYYSKGFKMNAEQCLQKAVSARPDLKSLDYQIKMAEKDIDVAKGKY